MGRPRKWDNDKERYSERDKRRKIARKERIPQFVGVDGEGVGEGEDHKYVLLGVGSDYIANENGLGWEEIFEFLWEKFQETPTAVFAGFYLGYDFTQWFKTLPEHRAKVLFDGATRKRTKSGNNHIPFPVEYKGWEFDLLSMKRFKLRKGNKGPSLYINDTGSYFQASFLSVIDPRKWDEPVVSQAEYELIKEGKERRNSAQLGPEMIKYNMLENEVLARVLGRLARGVKATGVNLKRNQWYGPGQVAQGWLRLQKNVPVPDQLDPKIATMARWSYYGGWFEIMAHGIVPGTTWEYDINSAYPWVMSQLPCLMHGEWKKAKIEWMYQEYTLVHAKVEGSDPYIGAMAHRLPDGRVMRPLKTAGWYWWKELVASKEAGLIDDYYVYEAYTYHPCSCAPPLRGVADLYQYRQAVGKDTPEGKAAKLVYNSCYGKFAQSVGHPAFGNAIYASLITSGCRTRILEAIATHPLRSKGVLMVATDGVYFTEPHDTLPISKELGEWSSECKKDITLFKPGVYWDDHTRQQIVNNDNPVFKARGISAKAFAKELEGIDQHYRQWREDSFGESLTRSDGTITHPRIRFKSGFAMVTCKQALQWKKWELAGSVRQDVELVQSADPVTKRKDIYLDGEIYRSRPYDDGGPELEGTLYKAQFGLPEHDLEEFGLSEDGWTLDSWRELLR